MEIDEFKSQEYWTVEVEFNRKQGSSVSSNSFPSYLTHFDSKKLNQFSISSHTEAKDIEEEINSLDFKVVGSKRNKMRKNPPAPYITSTLQQDAANKLHFTAMYTMKDVEAKVIRVDENEGNECGEVFKVLSSLKAGDPLHLSLLELKQHHTLPPSRYSEGALVKKLEELGIGRPSTYAITMKVLQDRNYVTVKNRVLYPEFRGRMML